jgi:hypothetical protein
MISRKLSRTAGTALMTLTLTALTIALGALAPVAATADSCPNAAERFGASANLPDCRAYELVTPMIKEDNDYIVGIHGFPDGNHALIQSLLPYPEAQNGQLTNVLSTRTGSGWVSTSLTVPQGPGEPDGLLSPDSGGNSEVVSFTEDFSAAFVNSPFADDPLDQNKGTNVYRIDIPGRQPSLAALPDSGPMTEALIEPPVHPGTGSGAGTYMAGNSGDGSSVFFETTVTLPTAPGTPVDTHTAGNELYERRGDHTYVVGVLPDGNTPSCGAEIADAGMNAYNNQVPNDVGAIAADGSNVVFRTPAFVSACVNEGEEPGSHLYLRQNNGTPQAITVPLPGNSLIARSADESKLFTLKKHEETRGEGTIYEYDIPTGQTTVIGQGVPVIISPDGSRVYYMSKPAYGPGEEKSTSEAQFYLYENGASKPIMDKNVATGFAGEYITRQGLSLLTDTASTTPDGSKLLFVDRAANVTGYNTDNPACGKYNVPIYGDENGLFKDCAEIYLYDVKSGSVTCVSCNQGGTPPLRDAHLFQEVNLLQAAIAHTPFLPIGAQTLSADGSQAFFETEEALVPQDTNGAYDVYEWENGHIYLLSSGQGSYGSFLAGMSKEGNDAFIQTTDRLLPQDIENSQQVYDARVDGGFPYTPPEYGCDSGQCQGPQTPAPVFAPPPSATFVGVGNPVREDVKLVPAPKQAKQKHKTPPKKHKAKKTRSRAKSGNFKRRGRK